MGFSLPRIAHWLLNFCGIVPQMPNNKNDVIRTRYADGNSITDLAYLFNLSPQRIFQIVNHKRR
jgi:hypothetical protein